MKEIEITRDETMVSDPEEYVKVLNGLVVDCFHGGYRKGYRNNMIVNMTVSAAMLGLDARGVLKAFQDTNLIEDSSDDESPRGRMDKVLNYIDRFEWDYMIDPLAEFYWLDKADEDMIPIKFVLVD